MALTMILADGRAVPIQSDLMPLICAQRGCKLMIAEIMSIPDARGVLTVTHAPLREQDPPAYLKVPYPRVMRQDWDSDSAGYERYFRSALGKWSSDLHAKGDEADQAAKLEATRSTSFPLTSKIPTALLADLVMKTELSGPADFFKSSDLYGLNEGYAMAGTAMAGPSMRTSAMWTTGYTSGFGFELNTRANGSALGPEKQFRLYVGMGGEIADIASPTICRERGCELQVLVKLPDERDNGDREIVHARGDFPSFTFRVAALRDWIDAGKQDRFERVLENFMRLLHATTPVASVEQSLGPHPYDDLALAPGSLTRVVRRQRPAFES